MKVCFIPKLTQRKGGLYLMAAQRGHHMSSMLLLPNVDSKEFSQLFLIKSAKAANNLSGFKIHL